MFGAITPLLPRHPYEAASSIANAHFGEPMNTRREIQGVNMVDGTVSWPLRKLAVLGDGFYGDTEQLIRSRTLLNFRRFSMRADVFEAVRRLAIEGPSARDVLLYRQHCRYRPPMVCPLCEQETLAQYGTLALLWPHQAPLVDACWEHGAGLIKRHFADDIRAQVGKAKRASAGDVEFARELVTVCEMGRDLDGAAATIAALLRDAGFQYENGCFCHTALSARFHSYVEKHVRNPLLQKIGCGEASVSYLVRFLRHAGMPIAPELLGLFLIFLRSAGSTVAPPLANSSCVTRKETPSTAWTTSRAQPGLTRPERHDLLVLARKGYSQDRIAAIKDIPPHVVRDGIRKSGLQAQARQARFEFLRRTARAAWKTAYREHGTVSRTTVRHTEPRAHKWLIGHDRDWLLANSVRYRKAPIGRGLFRLPEQQALIVSNLQSAMATLVKAGHSLPLTFSTVAEEAGMGRGNLERWISKDAGLARALRPLFHARGIRLTEFLRQLFSAL